MRATGGILDDDQFEKISTLDDEDRDFFKQIIKILKWSSFIMFINHNRHEITT